MISLPSACLLPACVAPIQQPSRTQGSRIEPAAPSDLQCRPQLAGQLLLGSRPLLPLLLLGAPPLLSEQLLCTWWRCSVALTLAFTGIASHAHTSRAS
mmetsp:Transcript_37795/g.93552  ORF Transcript_37795/g.93552 Transcript_37795/m.93552 type:complete len:98 (+) Transcript_37795:589-882(+)